MTSFLDRKQPWSFATENVPPFVIALRVVRAFYPSPYRLVRVHHNDVVTPSTTWEVMSGKVSVGQLWTFEATAEFVPRAGMPAADLSQEIERVQEVLGEMR